MKTRLIHLAALGAALLLFLVSLVQAAPGDLDSSFAGGGKFTFGYGNASAYPSAVVVQGDGKVVVAAANGSGAFAVLRYNSDGSRDASFGGDGEIVTAITPPGVGSAIAYANGVAVQGDGKIVVVGVTQGLGQGGTVTNFAVVRYNSDGSLDGSFGSGGKVTTDFGGNGDIAYSVQVLSDGKILVAGGHFVGTNDFYYALARYNPNGSLDTSFNGTGKVTTFIGVRGAGLADPVGIALLGDKIILAGTVSGGGAVNGYRVVRYNADGTLDQSFGVGGKVQTVVSTNDRAYSVAVQFGNNTDMHPDKIVVGGTSFDGVKNVFSVVRYNLDGTLDTSFHGNGIVLTPIPNYASANAVAVTVEHRDLLTRKIVLGGSARRAPGDPIIGDYAVVRLNSDGTPDSTFGANGLVTTSFGRYDDGLALILAGGRILLAGSSAELPPSTERNLGMVRYNTDGSLDSTFDEDGKKLDDIGARGFGARTLALQTDGKLVLGASGSLTNGTGLARLQADGTLDPSFGENGKVVFAGFTDESANALALQSDGKIVVAGSRLSGATSDFAVARYNEDGTRDTSFDGGLVTESITTGNNVAEALVVQADAKIVAAGYGTTAGKRDTALIRFTPDGDEDDSFGESGEVLVSLGIGDDEARAVVLQTDGKIVIAGAADGASGKRFFAARLTSDGLFDPSFNNGEGITYVSFASGPAEATSLALDAKGRLVLAGFVSNGEDYDFALARLTSSGLLDTTFGDGGRVTTPIGQADDNANAVVVQADGKILLAGSTSSNVVLGQVPVGVTQLGNYALARYRADGSLDETYGSGGVRLLEMEFGQNESANALILDPEDRAIVAGNAASMVGVARLDSSATGPTPTPTPPPAKLVNLSTRLRVEQGDNVLIGGFIVTGTEPKKVLVRAIGPSLPLDGKLADPSLELVGPGGTIKSNDDWRKGGQESEIIASTVPPTNDKESAVIATLPANNSAYTAIVRGKSNATGVGLVEIYDLDLEADSQLANISTRGFVQTGDDVLIGGFIPVGNEPRRVIVRAIGPSLPVEGKLADPTLELFDGNGMSLGINDNWRSGGQEAEIIASTVPPTNDKESALVLTLPGNAATTAVIRGQNGSTGVALIEIFALE